MMDHRACRFSVSSVNLMNVIKCLQVVYENLMMDMFFHRYYFPTYENDALLCTLSDSDADEDQETNHSLDVPVIAEDVSDLRELRQSSVLRKLLKNRS